MCHKAKKHFYSNREISSVKCGIIDEIDNDQDHMYIYWNHQLQDLTIFEKWEQSFENDRERPSFITMRQTH